MDWVEGMNKAVDYIEAHLTEEVDAAAAAHLAACSEYHFQRVFAYIAGATLSEYIRRRRMTLAAFELVTSGTRVLDLAVKYGYDSPTAFNRAFRGVHGLAPSEARSEGAHLTTYPRITFTMSVKGEQAMNYQIVKKDAFRVVGYRLHTPLDLESCFEQVPRFWQETAQSGGIANLCRLMDGGKPEGILGISTCDGGGYTGYMIAVASSAPVPEGMESYTVPEAAFAVFESIGPVPGAIQSVQKRVLTEWLPSSGYEYAPAPDVEVYPAGDQSAADYYSEVWLPIVKK